MKAWLGIFGIFGIGLGIGFFAGERYGKKQAMNIPNEVSNKAGEDGTDDKETANKIAEDQGYISSDDLTPTVEEMDQYLASFEHPSEDDEDEIEPEPDTKDENEQIEDELIELFCDESRWDSETEYDCHELYWYTEDNVICDEDEHRLEDAEERIGKNTIATMTEWDVPVIFARNSWSEDLYKITKIDNAYGRVVLGLDEDYEMYPGKDE